MSPLKSSYSVKEALEVAKNPMVQGYTKAESKITVDNVKVCFLWKYCSRILWWLCQKYFASSTAILKCLADANMQTRYGNRKKINRYSTF
ncbi:hypothetical protein Tcan_03186 [Toxocara canis]|uniref:Uncharacterized protein n=1 Tax=Toxocara canis TaxID=6265 RepID=A0A0B2V223_TOXCA|nr:hypothetical protein Tcan_03186 [Toxocara canis]